MAHTISAEETVQRLTHSETRVFAVVGSLPDEVTLDLSVDSLTPDEAESLAAQLISAANLARKLSFPEDPDLDTLIVED